MSLFENLKFIKISPTRNLKNEFNSKSKAIPLLKIVISVSSHQFISLNTVRLISFRARAGRTCLQS